MRIGAFTGGTTDVMCEPIARSLRSRGAEVRTNARADALLVEGGAVRGVRVDGEDLRTDHVIWR